MPVCGPPFSRTVRSLTPPPPVLGPCPRHVLSFLLQLLDKETLFPMSTELIKILLSRVNMRLCQQGVDALFHAFGVAEPKIEEHILKETLMMLLEKVMGEAVMQNALSFVYREYGGFGGPSDNTMLAILLYTAVRREGSRGCRDG